MIDFHSHILPAIDDGSKSEAESLLMLNALKNQGVTKVVATPHFYANNESVTHFTHRRQKAYDKLKDSLSEDLPEIVLGAEVRYYEGISRLEGLRELCIEDTEMLLLEMPASRWSEFMLRDLVDLTSKSRMTLVLAHIERYMSLQAGGVFEDLLSSGVLMQINAGFINDFFTRRKALNLLKSEKVHFIGTDCHDTVKRPPNMDRALEIISKKLGKDFLDYFINYGNEYFCENSDSILISKG
ncbi:MAG: capsular polysaccharide biosynthesis protein [Clostridia bacterium]|nr:capsular polysaccharide biosynthesis protein [Clostridia bacterium]